MTSLCSYLADLMGMPPAKKDPPAQELPHQSCGFPVGTADTTTLETPVLFMFFTKEGRPQGNIPPSCLPWESSIQSITAGLEPFMSAALENRVSSPGQVVPWAFVQAL